MDLVTIKAWVILTVLGGVRHCVNKDSGDWNVLKLLKMFLIDEIVSNLLKYFFHTQTCQLGIFYLQAQGNFHILAFLDREEFEPARLQAGVEKTFGVDIDLVLLVLELKVQVKSDTPLEI